MRALLLAALASITWTTTTSAQDFLPTERTAHPEKITRTKLNVRRGAAAFRFEIEYGDGVATDRAHHGSERIWVTGSKPRTSQLSGGDYWYAVSVFVPEDFDDISSKGNLFTNIAQIHNYNEGESTCDANALKGPPLVSIELRNGNANLRLSWTDEAALTRPNYKVLAPIDRMRGKWTDFVFNMNMGASPFFDLYMDGRLVVHSLDFQKVTKPNCTYVRPFQFGIYRPWLGERNLAKLPLKQVLIFDEFREGRSRAEVDFTLNPKLPTVD